jgi:hypothetical protein
MFAVVLKHCFNGTSLKYSVTELDCVPRTVTLPWKAAARNWLSKER